jgi:hypothetical protein
LDPVLKFQFNDPMNMTILNRGALSLAGAGALALLLSSSVATEVASIEVGDNVSYTWRKPLINGMGQQSLADLSGKPILVEFWGTR